MSRRQARECAIQFLYSADFNKDEDLEEQLGEFFNAESLEEEHSPGLLAGNDKKFALDILKGTLSRLDEIDVLIKKYSVGWQVERIARVDLAILRLAIYEIMYMDSIPESVSANEAIELAKKYSTEESSGFVNGIIGKIIRDRNVQGE